MTASCSTSVPHCFRVRNAIPHIFTERSAVQHIGKRFRGTQFSALVPCHQVLAIFLVHCFHGPSRVAIFLTKRVAKITVPSIGDGHIGELKRNFDFRPIDGGTVESISVGARTEFPFKHPRVGLDRGLNSGAVRDLIFAITVCTHRNHGRIVVVGFPPQSETWHLATVLLRIDDGVNLNDSTVIFNTTGRSGLTALHSFSCQVLPHVHGIHALRVFCSFHLELLEEIVASLGGAQFQWCHFEHGNGGVWFWSQPPLCLAICPGTERIPTVAPSGGARGPTVLALRVEEPLRWGGGVIELSVAARRQFDPAIVLQGVVRESVGTPSFVKR